MRNYRVNEFTELDFEYRLREIYGRRIYHNYSLSRFRSECKKLAKTIRRAISLNIESDNFHKERLNIFLDKLEDSFKDKDFEPSYILALVKIIFLLLGGEPSNVNVRRISQDVYLILDECRKVAYTQNLRQKAFLILKAHNYSPFCDAVKRDELLKKYMELGIKNFVEWYRQNYPNLYVDIF